MYKTLLRTLSALSIVTITASAGFAEHPDHTLNLDCNDPVYRYTEDCRDEVDIKPVTTDVWKDSFESGSVPPPTDPNPTSRSDQFISPEASIDHYTNKERVNLKFDINNDGTNTIVGTSIFYMVNNGNVRNFYAGIRAGADLGAPLVEAFPEAVWKTRFKAVGAYNLGVDFQVNEIFDLTVKFISNSADPEAMGELSGYIQHTGYYGFKIDAQFNNAGVITGTDGITYGRFQNAQAEPTNTIVGNLTGIIGERGTLGAFHSNGNSNSIIRGFAGGFRANGYSEDELVTLRKCVLDPFHAQCNEDKFDDLKVARIKLCIEADNASDTNQIECHNAILKNNCIRDPFQDHCDVQLGDVYDRAQTERIEFCRDNKSNLLCTEGRVAVIVACDGNHFSVNCANEPDSIRARIDFCADANNAGDPKCNHLLSTPNAARLSQSFNFEGLNTENRTNQFLQGTEAELTASKDGLTIEQPTDESSHEGSLNLAVLGGDASNGVSFFKGISGTSVFHYAGIFSSTDLGEPLTSTQPNAYWKGKFQVTGYLPSTDFTLEINFGDTGGAGNTDDSHVGRIQAFVKVDRTEHFYVDGGFTDKGVITGDVTYAFFTNSNRKRPSSRKIKGEVRGLIGEKGAVAAFISNDAGHLGYAGGFVARQPTQTEKTGLDRTCAFNPFSDKCEFGFESERDAEIARCRANREQEIADGYCDDIVQPIITDCEANPFAPKCVALNSFKAKRADMVNRCADPDNADRTGCSNVTDIIADCNLNPFGVYCDVSEFEEKRATFSTDCIANGNCDTVQRTPNAATWNSTANPFANVNAANAGGGFVHGTEDNLAGGDGLVPANVTKLNLSTATFGGSDKPLGGEAADGLAFGTDSSNKHYAGIFSGTDLGAPVAQKIGKASWVGRASFTRGGSVNSRNSEDFVLEVNFVDRKIEAYTSVFVIVGEFNDNGVIDGTVEDILANSQILGSLSGLIGEEGAVGVLYKANAFSGGFVARPPNSAQMASLNATCTDPKFAVQAYYNTRGQDPVYLANCHLNAVAKKDSLIKKCITGANAKTDECNLAAFTAVYVRETVVTCIDNPFGTGCGMALDDNYDLARNNRSEFCNNFLNAEHEFCKDDNLALVCGYDPFNTICVGGAHYTKQEEICAAEQDSVRCRPTVARICVGENDIFNRVCGDDYNDPRLGVCRNEYDNGPSVRCTATVARICTNDVFDDLCKHDAYFNNRVMECRDRDDDPRCTETITTACQRDLFDPFCNTTHSDARRVRIDLCNGLTGDVPEPNCMGDNLTNLCRYDPFNAVCPSSPSDDNKARAVKLLEMCANSAQADNLDCISILKRPNAATLLQALPAETLVTTGESNQFLNATKTTDPEKSGLDGLEAAVMAGTVRLLSGDAKSLNLSVLGKDADDGVGYAVVRNRNSSKFRHFAGIFSSTDLGAPLTQTNTKVGWKGKIQVPGYSLKSDDFTLEITFGNAGKGKVEAFVYDSVDRYFHLKGGFDSKGLITGTATFGHFANHARNGTIAKKVTGTLRGLIGQDGAVGTFVSGSSKFFGFGGGFVARPLTAGETTTLNTTCDMNPFDTKCNFGFDAVRSARVELCEQDSNASNRLCTGGAGAVITGCKANPFGADCTWDGFDAERNMRVELCEQDSNASNPLCTGGASVAITGCKANPFRTDCTWDTFNDARNARLAICYDAVADDERCVGTAATIVTDCKADLFGADCTWDAFEDVRVMFINRCYADATGTGCTAGANTVITDCNANAFGPNCYFNVFKVARQALLKACKNNTSDCTPSIKASILTQPNAATWEHSFKTGDNIEDLGSLPDAATYYQNKPFLKNTESALQPDSGIEVQNEYGTTTSTYKSLDLSTATFNISGTPNGKGTALGGDPKDGVAYFRGRDSGQEHNNIFAEYNWYVGIFSTTDLGAPVTDKRGTASWVGSFYHNNISKDFVLEVNFDTQSIEAFIAYIKYRYLASIDYYLNYRHSADIDYYLKGKYDDNGVISGTVVRLEFTDNNRDKPNKPNQQNFVGSSLTGLIGKEGAVGAYVGRDLSYGWLVGSFVARPATDVDGVVDYLDGVCDADDGNPFHEYCYLRQDARKAVIDNCITGKDVLNNDNCLSARKYHSCLLRPFDEDCKRTFAYYNIAEDKPYYQIVRANRSAFCKETTNKNDAFCTDAQRVALCSYHPFHTICDSTDGLYNEARQAVCKAGFDHPDCATDTYTTTSDNVTMVSWLSGFYKDKGFLPQTEPDVVRPRNQFLQETADWIDNGHVTIGTDYRGVPIYYSLNLNEATFDGLELGGDVADGLAFFTGVNNEHYAGILSGTDLGKPLIEATTGGKFYGQFQIGDSLKKDFTLEIGFYTEGTGTVKAFVHLYDANYYLLSGKFDDNGVISGTVNYGKFPNHDRDDTIESASTVTLTGLIGEEGAVGLFGGSRFVAVPKDVIPLDPNVKFSDWLRIFGNTPSLPRYAPQNEPRQTLFVQGRETHLYTGRFGEFVRPISPLTLADVRTDGQVADGVDYLSEIHRHYNSQTGTHESQTYHVAGLLSGTDLGAPLDVSVEANWKGRLGLIANGSEVTLRDIALTVNFDDTSIIIVDSKTDDDTHFVNFDNLSWDNTSGVITGDINYNPGDALDNLDIDSADSPGIVRGLIGQDGAVAAFRSTGTVDTPYAGGFVAVPSTVYAQTVGFSDWVNSFGNTPRLLTRIPNGPATQNQFLQGTDTDLSIEHFDDIARPRPLTLADVNTDGKGADGVAYMSGTHWLNAQITLHAAGILSGTNLGAVLDESVAADWSGKLGMIVDGSEVTLRDIDLTVDFESKTIRYSSAINGAHFVKLNAKWVNINSPDGVLKGTITYNPGPALNPDTNSVGKVRGLIGQRGAVGAFISNHDNPSSKASYAGGFVAVPGSAFSQIVNFSDWVRSFRDTSSPLPDHLSGDSSQQTLFVQGKATGLSTNHLSDVVRPNPLTLADGDLGGQSADGVTYVSGTQRSYNLQTGAFDIITKHHYAGILSGTHLGAALEVKPAVDGTDVTANWAGKLGMIVDYDTPVESSITLKVNYTDQNITLNRTAIGLGAVSFTDVGWDNDSGFYSGVITYDPNDSARPNSEGKVTGLIGQQGAVGAFISNHDNSWSKAGYAGGFVAAPPSE